jgi:desampylase
MLTLAVELPPALAQHLRRWATAAAPRECIAALGGQPPGDTWRVATFWPLPNTAPGHDRFEVAPAAFAAAVAGLAAAGNQWLGFVHSHPNGRAEPSATDRAELWRGCLQLIVASDRIAAFCLHQQHAGVRTESLPLPPETA